MLINEIENPNKTRFFKKFNPEDKFKFNFSDASLTTGMSPAGIDLVTSGTFQWDPDQQQFTDITKNVPIEPYSKTEQILFRKLGWRDVTDTKTNPKNYKIEPVNHNGQWYDFDKSEGMWYEIVKKKVPSLNKDGKQEFDSEGNPETTIKSVPDNPVAPGTRMEKLLFKKAGFKVTGYRSNPLSPNLGIGYRDPKDLKQIKKQYAPPAAPAL